MLEYPSIYNLSSMNISTSNVLPTCFHHRITAPGHKRCPDITIRRINHLRPCARALAVRDRRYITIKGRRWYDTRDSIIDGGAK